MKDFSRDKGVRKESYTSKEQIGCGMVTVLERTAVVYRADDLTSAAQAIPDFAIEQIVVNGL